MDETPVGEKTLGVSEFRTVDLKGMRVRPRARE